MAIKFYEHQSFTFYQKTEFWTLQDQKAFVVDKVNVAVKVKVTFILDFEGNIVDYGERAALQHFHLFPQYFH